LKPTVTVVDYGMGNLFSVCRAFELCGGEVVLASTPEEVLAAKRLVLPVVGAFANGMKELQDLQLITTIKQFASSKKPFLGICLGMQMLLSASEEFGECNGLGLLPGRVIPISPTGNGGEPHKIPHIGWNELIRSQGTEWQGTILDGLKENDTMYFVHSYTAIPDNPAHLLASCSYDVRILSAVIRAGSIYGCQFHPEKSGKAGLKMVRTFLHME
jgi:imidazole glycerol-phosphate synthase subunit HisH